VYIYIYIYIYIYSYLINYEDFNNLNGNGDMAGTGIMTGICTSPYPSPYPIEKVRDSPYPYPYPVNAGIPRQTGDGFGQYPRGRVYLPSLNGAGRGEDGFRYPILILFEKINPHLHT